VDILRLQFLPELKIRRGDDDLPRLHRGDGGGGWT